MVYLRNFLLPAFSWIDADFARRPDTLSLIVGGPLYAVETKPAIACRRDIEGQVLDDADQPSRDCLKQAS